MGLVASVFSLPGFSASGGKVPRMIRGHDSAAARTSRMSAALSFTNIKPDAGCALRHGSFAAIARVKEE
jgi:hypothetical protein